MEEENPKLNHLNCTGNEDRIQDCLSNTTAESCSTAVVLCQGKYVHMAACVQTVCVYS